MLFMEDDPTLTDGKIESELWNAVSGDSTTMESRLAQWAIHYGLRLIERSTKLDMLNKAVADYVASEDDCLPVSDNPDAIPEHDSDCLMSEMAYALKIVQSGQFCPECEEWTADHDPQDH